MLEQLFGSKTRVKLLTLFLNNPDKSFYVREITREVGSLINSVRRELDNLAKAKIINIAEPDENEDQEDVKLKMRKYFKLNKDCVLVDEIKHLFIKNKIFFKEEFIDKIQKFSDLKYLLLSGFFVDSESSVDLLMVAEGKKEIIAELIRDFEKSMDREIKFTIFSEADFKYRKELGDRFVLNLINCKNNIILIDKLSKNQTG